MPSDSSSVGDGFNNSPNSTGRAARSQSSTPLVESRTRSIRTISMKAFSNWATSFGFGTEAISHVLPVRDGLSIATNRIYAILQEHEHVTKNANKQDRPRPWVRFERTYTGVTLHMDWYRNHRDDYVLAVEDDASGYVFDLIETDGPRQIASSC